MIIFIVYLIFMGFILMFMIRNQLVYKERKKLADWIFKQDDWREKYSLLDKYSYDEMVHKFWIPVSSFYKDIYN